MGGLADGGLSGLSCFRWWRGACLDVASRVCSPLLVFFLLDSNKVRRTNGCIRSSSRSVIFDIARPEF
jgi:hypothetical protein